MTTTHPLTLRDWEARAINDGSASMLWRVVEPQPDLCSPWLAPQEIAIADRNGDALVASGDEHPKAADYHRPIPCPFGRPGDLVVWNGTTREVARVCLKQINTISADEIKASGIEHGECGWRMAFAQQWNKDNPDRAWAGNPWAWGVEFKRKGTA